MSLFDFCYTKASVSAGKVVKVKKKKRRRNEDSSQLNTVPSAYHNNSPLQEINCCQEKEIGETEGCVPRKRAQPQRGNSCTVKKTEPGAAANEFAGPLARMD